MKYIQAFYENMYLCLYYRQLSINEYEPMIMPVIIISFCQFNNIATIINLILTILSINIPSYFFWGYFIICIILFISNHYNYKRKTEYLLKNQKMYPEYMGLWMMIYILSSVILFVYSIELNFR